MGHDRSELDADGADFDAILAWLETGARSDTLQRAETADPERLAARVALTRALCARLAEAALPPLSAAAHARALQLGAAPGVIDAGLARGTEVIGRVWRTLRAALVREGFDAVPAFRSAAHGATDGQKGSFLALFEVEGYDIDVSLSERGTLIGQILPIADAPPFAGGRCTVVPLDASRAPRSTPIDLEGEFVLEGPHDGAIELVLEQGEAHESPLRIVIERIDLARGTPGAGRDGEPA